MEKRNFSLSTGTRGEYRAPDASLRCPYARIAAETWEEGINLQEAASGVDGVDVADDLEVLERG